MFKVIFLFVIFCAVWIVTNAINQIMIGKMQQRLQQQRIDAAYAQISRLIVRTLAESAGKRRANND